MQTWMTQCWQFLCEGLSSFNPKGFYHYAHMHVLSVYLKEEKVRTLAAQKKMHSILSHLVIH